MALLPALPIGFGLVAATASVAVAARRWAIPHSILLVLAGLAAGFLPWMPRIELSPELVLTLLLPPLLYSSGVGMSWRGFKANLRPILLLAVGCVIFTASVVAVLCHYVSPPDAVAPMAIARRFRVPSRILTILEGEGLVNDATALILFSFAVAAVVEGQEFSLADATIQFFTIVTAELAWGLAVGWGALTLRRWAHEPRVEIVLALLTPFAAFWVPELLGGSGVLATVTAGLYVSWNGPRFISPATRLQGFFVWDLVVYLIEGVIFLLTGLQARVVAEGLDMAQWVYFALASLMVCVTIIVVRFVWVFFATWLPRALWPPMQQSDPTPPWQAIFLVAFTGIRGVVSLAAALSIPLMAGDAPFPARGLLLLITFSVILVTLVGQGLTFPWVIRKLGLVEAGWREAHEAKQREVAARVHSIDAALARLDALEGAASDPDTIAALRRRHEDRRAYFVAACQDLAEGHAILSASALQLRFLNAERASIAEIYARGEINDEARRRIERELDLEDSRIRHSAESGGIR